MAQSNVAVDVVDEETEQNAKHSCRIKYSPTIVVVVCTRKVVGNVSTTFKLCYIYTILHYMLQCLYNINYI